MSRKAKAAFGNAAAAAQTAPAQEQEQSSQAENSIPYEELKKQYVQVLEEKESLIAQIAKCIEEKQELESSAARLKGNVVELSKYQELEMKNSELEFDNARLQAEIVQLTSQLEDAKNGTNEVSFIQKTPVMSKHVLYNKMNYRNNGYGSWN